MSPDEILPADLKNYERALLALAPTASRIDRDRLMVRLGEQSAVGVRVRGTSASLWKCATAASLVVA
jgi:hypothetical protein